MAKTEEIVSDMMTTMKRTMTKFTKLMGRSTKVQDLWIRVKIQERVSQYALSR